jgi:hypothetical protein
MALAQDTLVDTAGVISGADCQLFFWLQQVAALAEFRSAIRCSPTLQRTTVMKLPTEQPGKLQE